MEHIIEESLADFDYTPIRADQMTEPGSITAQIIEKIVECDLLIADLTHHNPNVFYELAVRHATAKPYIQLIDKSQSIPFDISDLRTIQYDFDVDVAKRAANQIEEQIKSIQQSGDEFDNPISKSANLKSWRESEDPTQQNLAEVMNMMSELVKKVDSINKKVDNDQNILKMYGESSDSYDDLMLEAARNKYLQELSKQDKNELKEISDVDELPD